MGNIDQHYQANVDCSIGSGRRFTVQDKVSLGIGLLGFFLATSFGVAALTIQQKHTLAMADFVAAGSLLFLAIWIYLKPSTLMPRCFLITFICLLFYYYFVTGGADGFGFLWGILIPILAPFFLGHKIGIIVTLIYLIIFLLTLLLGQRIFPSFEIGISFTMTRYFAEYIVAAIIVSLYSYDQNRDKMAISAEIKRREASDERHRTLFADSPDAHLLLEDGKFTECNHAMESLFACNREDIIGYTPEIISAQYQPDGRPSAVVAQEKIEETLKNGKCRFTWKYKRFNGEEFWASISMASTFLDNRQVILAVCQDINERKLAEEKLATLLTETERINRLMTGREDRIIELKKEINRLSIELGREVVYSSVEKNK